ncbi:MAG: translational GTPase TypA [Deltaproteobacteria bacterium]|jgi:GTP-binding protein|nr:translational GTPase TypA [Deltaproteobacteria bacterium]MBT6435957.1 translational GTPase TypA [Deltaproteobacteria bacterium]
MSNETHLRTVAIVAHVDHGKTTLVDALFQQSGMYRENQAVVERAMDSMDQERERGITILAKCTSVQYDPFNLQLVDTPGHADFGGEVERTLRMVDGVLLLVDAAEGPMPQTRFVLRKAMDLKLPAVLVINKIDRSDRRIEEVINECYDLFIDLGADDNQINFPIIYTNGRAGTATTDLDVEGTDLRPLVDSIIAHLPPTQRHLDKGFCMQVNQLGYDEYVGRLVIGRILSGTVKVNQTVHLEGEAHSYNARATGIFGFHGTERHPKDLAEGGDIIALAGLNECFIGDTVSAPDAIEKLPPIHVDEPTVSMVFQVNDGPFAGRSGGKYLTSRHLRERLQKEALGNVSIRIKDGDTPDQFRVMGRGELQLAVLIESLRRELYEFCVRKPEVVIREIEGEKQEPRERLVVDVPLDFTGVVNELIGPRKGILEDQKLEGERMRIEFLIPTRGLFGLRNQMLTSTKGTAIMHSNFEDWIPVIGNIPQRLVGSLVADRPGKTTSYALFNLQPRGTLFTDVGIDVYEGMVIGEHARANCLNVNGVREKQLTNHRASGKDDATVVTTPRPMPLERCIEWIRDDEMVEVTPDMIRIRKRVLQANKRPKSHGG